MPEHVDKSLALLQCRLLFVMSMGPKAMRAMQSRSRRECHGRGSEDTAQQDRRSRLDWHSLTSLSHAAHRNRLTRCPFAFSPVLLFIGHTSLLIQPFILCRTVTHLRSGCYA